MPTSQRGTWTPINTKIQTMRQRWLGCWGRREACRNTRDGNAGWHLVAWHFIWFLPVCAQKNSKLRNNNAPTNRPES